jgi:hypothetical protein
LLTLYYFTFDIGFMRDIAVETQAFAGIKIRVTCAFRVEIVMVDMQ